MTHVALYRRFRPNNFDDVIGQDALINTLRGQITNGRINHAYLFCGPRGIGKTTVARILAKAINCEKPAKGNFCGKCDSCNALNNSSNFDIIEIDAASNNGVDNIRDLRENIKFMPAIGKYRVYIIDEVHMLSISAFNALLKTLEEPPAHIVFIMATTEPGKLPVTVLSRCQRFDFNRFKASDIVKLLKKVSKEANINIEIGAIESIARASDGGARDAVSLMDQCSAFANGKITQESVSTILGSANRLMYFALAESILTQDTSRALRGFNKMLDDGCNTLSVAKDLMGHFRDLFIAKHVDDVAETLSFDEVMASRLVSQAAKATEGVLIRCIDLFSRLESDLRYASHPRVFIELAIAKACRSENDKSYDTLLERVEKIEKQISSGEISFVSNKDGDKSVDSKKKDKILKSHEQDFSDSAETPIDTEANQSYDLGEPPAEEYFPYVDVEQKIDKKKDNATKPKKKVESQTSLAGVSTKIEKNETTRENKEKVKPKISKNEDAEKLWKQTTDLLKKQKKMSVVTAMKKAVAKSLDGDVLTIMYDENLAGLERLEDKSNLRMINEALSSTAGIELKIKVELRVLDEADLSFLEDLNKFPKDLINKKN